MYWHKIVLIHCLAAMFHQISKRSTTVKCITNGTTMFRKWMQYRLFIYVTLFTSVCRIHIYWVEWFIQFLLPKHRQLCVSYLIINLFKLGLVQTIICNNAQYNQQKTLPNKVPWVCPFIELSLKYVVSSLGTSNHMDNFAVNFKF